MVKLDKKALMPIVVLVSICIVVAALLGAVNMLTAPEIAEREAEKANAALLVVLPGAKNFEKIESLEGYPKEIKTAYKADKGFVFEVSTKGKEAMTVMCGVDTDGALVGIDIIVESETPDYKNKVFPLMLGEGGKYNGKTSETLEPEIVSGATLTSNGIYSAVKASLDAYVVANGGEIEGGEEPNPFIRPDSEVITLAGALVSGSEGFTKVELETESETLIGIYKENGGKGYVAYTLVMSDYGAPETETLIHVQNNGKIKDIKKLVWKTSDAIYGYVPPSVEAVDEFYARLLSNNLESIGEVELVSNATNTSTKLVNALKEALTEIEALIIKDMPTAEAEVLSLAGELVGKKTDFENLTPSGAEYLRRLYRDKNGNGYVAYVVVISSNYGTVESEALIHIGNDGIIKNIKRLVWKTSEAGWGYVPPSAESVDAFYSGLLNKGTLTIGEVELVSNATNTSTNVVSSFTEALMAVDELIPQYKTVNKAPRIIGITVLFASIVSFVVLFIIIRGRRGGKKR